MPIKIKRVSFALTLRLCAFAVDFECFTASQCSTRGMARVNSGTEASNWVPSSAVIW